MPPKLRTVCKLLVPVAGDAVARINLPALALEIRYAQASAGFDLFGARTNALAFLLQQYMVC